MLLYFRRDIARICAAWWRSVRGDHGTDWRARLGRHDHDAAMAWYIALGSVPIVLLGLLFQDAIENTFRNLYLTALMLAVFALLLGWADRVGAKRRTLRELSAGQAVAFVRPGARARPGRLALGRHDHRGPAHGLHARGGGTLLVPPRDPRRHGLGLLPALQVRGRAGARAPGAGRPSSRRSSRSSSGTSSSSRSSRSSRPSATRRSWSTASCSRRSSCCSCSSACSRRADDRLDPVSRPGRRPGRRGGAPVPPTGSEPAGALEDAVEHDAAARHEGEGERYPSAQCSSGMCWKFMPYTPATIVGYTRIAAHAEILRMSSF